MIDSQDVKTKMNDDGLRAIAPGTVRFSIKADDTMENMQVHAAFKDFCRVENDNNYTQGLRKLLEYYQSDAKIETIFNLIQEQNVALQDLTASVVELQTPKVKEVNEEESKDSF
jgi:hypothetical protein